MLNTDDHAAWQVMHGVLAYRDEFPLRQGRAGPTTPAVQYILNGGRLGGWDVHAGDVLDARTGRRGLRATLERGSKVGQGHRDQWLAKLAQCGLPPEQSIRVGDADYAMADYVAQAQRDVWRNGEREWSWTLMALTCYLPSNAVWIAGDGKPWSMEQLVRLEAEQEIDNSTCGGTHRLIGLSMALNQRANQGGSLQGPWGLADQKIAHAIRAARLLQNSDGSFSSNYFARGGRSPDLAETIRTSGHTLEFLATALTDRQLDEPWIRRAAVFLCDVLQKTKDVPLECGAPVPRRSRPDSLSRAAVRPARLCS